MSEREEENLVVALNSSMPDYMHDNGKWRQVGRIRSERTVSPLLKSLDSSPSTGYIPPKVREPHEHPILP